LNERISKEKKTNMFSRKAEIDKPPVTENEADVVFMVDVYHHIENRVDYFSKLKTSLKPNGALVVVDFKKGDFEHGPPDEMKLAHEQIITELAKAGFENTVIDTTTLQFQYLLKFK
jgi:SAM-dependent methyltransferase